MDHPICAVAAVTACAALALVAPTKGRDLARRCQEELARLGITARLMALSLALGMTWGLCPMYLPILCSLIIITVSGLMGLSVPASVVGFQMANPFYVLFLIPFIRAGEWICGAPLVDLHGLLAALNGDPWEALHLFGNMFAMALIPWALACPVVFALSYIIFLPMCKAIEGEQLEAQEHDRTITPYVLCE